MKCQKERKEGRKASTCSLPLNRGWIGSLCDGLHHLVERVIPEDAINKTEKLRFEMVNIDFERVRQSGEMCCLKCIPRIVITTTAMCLWVERELLPVRIPFL